MKVSINIARLFCPKNHIDKGDVPELFRKNLGKTGGIFLATLGNPTNNIILSWGLAKQDPTGAYVSTE